MKITRTIANLWEFTARALGSLRSASKNEAYLFAAFSPWQNLNFLPFPHGQGA